MAADVGDSIKGKTGRRRTQLLLPGAILLAVLTGAFGFYAAYTGVLPVPGQNGSHAKGAKTLPVIAFVPVDPVVVSLGHGGSDRHLRFRAQLEVNQPYEAEVAALLPRIVDVLNGYLRAVDAASLDEPTALIRTRAQLLRRIQMVTGEGRVRDLLVAEFVVN
ncbi:flagellar basal body-associated FliL family protein [Neotabrizicola shimadae]|uniref:Flagellar protein FliL n=1 Tax=Neotabrizicola shimadae TaxID=2807096 RepID=A0A8G0ZVU8_9RHOB|nr:flagellar basal body-associated FliL family protein [Neotabrizicola shimadae]QYZ69802.1 flagellar basal body-associated FliL family protein [Neotabrizicola shimadae]